MIGVAGISHATAPVALRERLAVAADALPEALAALRERHGAAVLLSTCNRTELYLSEPLDPAALRAALRAVAPVAAETPDEAIYTLSDSAAARHLLRVASGLDSLLLGEDQILGQVREALGAAAAAGTTDRLLSRLFHLAISTGRRVRSETALGLHARSVSAAAVAMVREWLGDLRERTVVVYGAGAAGRLSALALREAEAGRLIIVSRTLAHAEELAAETNGEALPLDDLAGALGEADAAILAAAAPTPAVTRALLGNRRTADRRLLLIDIAVPRAAETAVALTPGVMLLNVDALGAAQDVPALTALDAAETIVAEETARLEAWWESLRVVPTITALRGRAEAIRRGELARSLGKMPDLSERERERIEALTAAIVNKLLHEPIQRLKQPGAGAQYAALVHDLFALPGPNPQQPFPATAHEGFAGPAVAPWPPADFDASSSGERDPREAAR
jgi:glutamyl-tRNA reductase